jgi:SAM-dependent methyltransferase
VSAQAAYDAIADVYDHFTAHHRYDEWCATLEGLASEQGLRGNRLLDLACGTGKSFMPFLRRGYDVVACDLSEAMLEQAREKAGPDVRLLRRDMRELERLGTFDLVTCLSDSVNYLTAPDDLAGCFGGVAKNLAPDGLMVFDANSCWCYRAFWGSASVVPDAELTLVWRGRTPADFAPGDLARAELLVLTRRDDGFWDERVIEHVEQHHPEATVRAAAAAAGLEIAAVRGLNMDGSVDPEFDELRHNKAVYVARLAG